MSRIIVAIVIVCSFFAGSGVGVIGLLWSTGGTGEASRETIEIIPTLSLSRPTVVPESNMTSQDISQLSTHLNGLAAQISSISGFPDATPPSISIEGLERQVVAMSAQLAEVAPSAPSNRDATEDAPISGLGRLLYRISERGSQARFRINEVLAGNEIEVVGVSNRVGGDFIVDFANPANSELGVIAINVRTLRTDEEFRDQSIRSLILQSSKDEYEFVLFSPTALQGLPEVVQVGDVVEFQIIGNLTIMDTTREVVFDAQVTVVSEDVIEGFAQTAILYNDFGITIEAPPQIASVGDEVRLEIDFVANQVSE